MLVVVDFEELGKSRLTNVETDEDDLLAQQCEADRQVGGVERLTFTRRTGSEEDDLLVLGQHELYIGTHGTENFFHLVVFILVNHDVGLRFSGFTCHSHVGKDRQLGETCHIVVTFNLIAEEGHEEEN